MMKYTEAQKIEFLAKIYAPLIEPEISGSIHTFTCYHQQKEAMMIFLTHEKLLKNCKYLILLVI